MEWSLPAQAGCGPLPGAAPLRGVLQVDRALRKLHIASETACKHRCTTFAPRPSELLQVIEHREELKVALETAGVNGTAGTGRQGSRPPSPLLEAVLSLELSHPNIIKTYKYETRTVQVGCVQKCPIASEECRGSFWVRWCKTGTFRLAIVLAMSLCCCLSGASHRNLTSSCCSLCSRTLPPCHALTAAWQLPGMLPSCLCTLRYPAAVLWHHLLWSQALWRLACNTVATLHEPHL